jgi:DNA (cytosine-5)-methyltransferase 1
VRPRLLDLFAGAGGAGMGYHRAGFEVVGVDIKPQPNYPFEFHKFDALEFLRDAIIDDFDAIHASPPCQAYSIVSAFQGVREDHPDLVDETRRLLDASGLPWVIENVVGAPIRADVKLCGEMFGLGVHRHRHFETHGFFVMQPPHSRHNLKGAETNTETREGYARGVYGHMADWRGAAKAMGVEWMGAPDEVAQAIPPAYTEHIGSFLYREICEGSQDGEFGEAA